MARGLFMRKFIVIKKHISEFPNPINFNKGDTISIGDEYVGDEGWDNWIYCNFNEIQGFVPKQLIDFIDNNHGVANEDYTAHELCVAPGELLFSLRELNNWIWAKNENNEKGWVPLSNVSEIIE